LRACPLNNIQLCGICAEKHATKNCSMLPDLKAIYKGEIKVVESLYYVAPKRPWKPRVVGMLQNFN